MIQNVNIERKLSEQMMGLSRLIILTAGEDDEKKRCRFGRSEGILPAVDKKCLHRSSKKNFSRGQTWRKSSSSLRNLFNKTCFPIYQTSIRRFSTPYNLLALHGSRWRCGFLSYALSYEVMIVAFVIALFLMRKHRIALELIITSRSYRSP